jgi:hypothetical protein
MLQRMMILSSITVLAVITRSDSDDAVHSVHAALWIASSSLAMTIQPHLITL